MTLSGYLAQRGTKAKALTRGEAALLGIPYPLQAGWPRRYGAVEIDEVMCERLAACAEAAGQVAKERARRAKAKAAVSTVAQRAPKAACSPAPSKIVCGFKLRKARRYRTRTSAPWA